MASSSDPADSMLEAALGLLSNSWVHAFLFPDDRSTYVRQLHHALSQQPSATAEVHFGTQASVGPLDTLPGLDRKLRLLSVPSFSTGSITVGFEVTHALRDSSPFPVHAPRHIARYVRDDDSGIMLIVAEHPHLGFTELTCCTQLSPGCRSQVYVVMHAALLRQALNSLHSATYDRDAICKATALSYFSVDMRPCPTCGSNTVALCACTLKVKRKAHPLDHDAELQNLASYTGDYGGLAKMRLMHNGRNAYSATFVSKIEAIFMDDPAIRTNMSAWAMTHVSSNETMYITNYSMPMLTTSENDEPLLIKPAPRSADESTEGDDSASSRMERMTTASEKRKERCHVAQFPAETGELLGRALLNSPATNRKASCGGKVAPSARKTERKPRQTFSKSSASSASKTSAISAPSNFSTSESLTRALLHSDRDRAAAARDDAATGVVGAPKKPDAGWAVARAKQSMDSKAAAIANPLFTHGPGKQATVCSVAFPSVMTAQPSTPAAALTGSNRASTAAGIGDSATRNRANVDGGETCAATGGNKSMVSLPASRSLQAVEMATSASLNAYNASVAARMVGLVPLPQMVQRGTDGQQVGLHQAIPLAPAPLMVGSVCAARRGRIMDLVGSKDEIRKARNRASAQRSNERKKREVEKLKRDVEECSAKARELKRREEMMRRENEGLRAAVAAERARVDGW